MKEIGSKTGGVELQPNEYVPDGSVRLAPSAPDSRGRLNGDGSKSKIAAERPVYVDLASAIGRIVDLEAQVSNLQRHAIACEKFRNPMMTRSEPGPIDLDALRREVTDLALDVKLLTRRIASIGG